LPHLSAGLAGVLDALDAVARAGAPAHATGATGLALFAAELARVVDTTGAVTAASAACAAATRLVQIAALLTRHVDATETGLETLVEAGEVTTRFVATAAHRIGADLFDALRSRCRACGGTTAARLIRAAAGPASAGVGAERARAAAVVATAVAARLIDAAASRAHLGVGTDRSALAIATAAGLRRRAAIGLTRPSAALRATADAEADGTRRPGTACLIFGAARLALAATATARAHGASLTVAVAAILLRGTTRLTCTGGARTEAAAAHGTVRDALVADTTAACAAHVTRAARLPVSAARFTRAARTGRASVAHVAFTTSFVDRTAFIGRDRRTTTLARTSITSSRAHARASVTGGTWASSGWRTARGIRAGRARRASSACFSG
jgi:hypothetical protein